MATPRLRFLAWFLWGASIVLTAVGLLFLVLNGEVRHANSVGSPVLDGVFSMLFLTFPTVGLAVALREPRNAIGWLFLGAGLGVAGEDAALTWSAYTLVVSPGALPGGEVAALVADAIWLPALGAASLLLFVLFPTGRPMSPRWRWFVWVVCIDLAVYGLATFLKPGGLYFYPDRENPWGVEAMTALEPLVDATSPVMFGALLVGLGALGLRFRRAAGVERQQMKWLVYAGSVWAAALPGLIWLGEQGDARIAGVLVGDLAFSALITSIPLAVGMAILRYRLYDIDLVINRTVVYGSLTASLAATYLGLVLVMRLVLDPVTGESDIAVAGSTLAVAALVRPLRSRIQSVVDRRFYRARYDMSRTIEGFTARLRDELDLETVGTDLRRVVHDTVQPAFVSLWLREAVP